MGHSRIRNSGPIFISYIAPNIPNCSWLLVEGVKPAGNIEDKLVIFQNAIITCRVQIILRESIRRCIWALIEKVGSRGIGFPKFKPRLRVSSCGDFRIQPVPNYPI